MMLESHTEGKSRFIFSATTKNSKMGEICVADARYLFYNISD